MADTRQIAGEVDASPRRRARSEALLRDEVTPVRHARRRRAARIAAVFALVACAALVAGGAAAVTGAISAPALAEEERLAAAEAEIEARIDEPPLPAPAESIPAPSLAAVAPLADLCAAPEVADALAAGDDAAAIAAGGGGEALRAAVVEGRAPCIALDDSARLWSVINKVRPHDPVDYRPSPLTMPDGVRNLAGGALRADAAAALTRMVAAAREEGAGEIALASAFRSYTTQQGSYGRQVSSRGVEGADLVSARPGHSEHQSGLAADVVACSGGCGSLDDLAGTAQGDWIVANAWRFGWIVRYEADRTPITGYLPEPWHLRYIGPQLAEAYHAGGWHTLEEFFALPAAPDYFG
ncbi:M15 family metallopeptidase [Microbacterium hominis]|uniref:M15 family metallopeptidase n=1 Tax=Microbacterium hominis TaxID=162426 RepID=A0A7D4PKA3_9MICO|nr:M15 family metallopeptidase [Microbacterium hominis]QKJ18150.1 M15 family metallopeptidase [Microbacterium hominis]